MTGNRGGQRRRGARASKASPARIQALKTLQLWRERDGFVQDIMASTVDDADLTSEDRAFATRLVMGVVSCRGTLDEALDSCLDSPRDVRPNVRDALRVSAYELLFLGKSAHAAVDQGVELVRFVAPRASGLANAVLHRLAKRASEFPFGDPLLDLSAFARSQGFPLWLTERLTDDLGSAEARAFMEASNEPAPLFVAESAIKAAPGEVQAVLEAAGAHPVPVNLSGEAVPGCFRLGDRRALLAPPADALLRGGKMLVADAASQAMAAEVAKVACTLQEAKGDSFAFLEVGAGRATKTILIESDVFRQRGEQLNRHTTIDNAAFKSDLLRERTKAHGVIISDSLTGDAADLIAILGEKRFDLIFIDAPCTGLGTLRRHPEIRWRLRPETIVEAAVLDARFLRSAAAQLNPGGAIAYATCTVTPEENEGAIAKFLESKEGEGFKLERTLKTELLPGGTSPDAHHLSILFQHDRCLFSKR